MRKLAISLLLALLTVSASQGDVAAPSAAGGTLTQPIANRNAFSLPAPGLSARELREFALGNRIFNTNWVVAPASTTGFDGLGPTFNRNSCSGCHLRDGRGRPPVAGESTFQSMLVRLSVGGIDANGGPAPLENYGEQLNDRAIPGVKAEGSVSVSYTEQPGHYGDGQAFSLRRPSYAFHDLQFGPLPKNAMFSPRVAPAVFGLGLLEAIAEKSIRAAADPDDRNGDGISGRTNEVFDVISGKPALGRFGWKANAPSLRAQAAMAALGDIGLTSGPRPQENCPAAQADCKQAANGGQPELDARFLDSLTLYSQVLAVPARRDPDSAKVKRGDVLFTQFGCAGCHTPTQQTDANHPLALLHRQTFHPYTDLLLHDMGDGLADGRPDFKANGREWRTPPLWGLGLLKQTNEHEFLLHDGRARGFAEAILWHGGEAQAAKERFRSAPSADRDALIALLYSL